jgi:peptidylprolyl isomerase
MKMICATLAPSLALAVPASAQEGPKGAASPAELVAAAQAADWVAIAPSDLLVMTLTPDREGNNRQVTIQLMPGPLSQGWVGNIRKLAMAHWWDGLAITRVQDNYVVQWGDPDAEDKAKAKALPQGLTTVPEAAYVIESGTSQSTPIIAASGDYNSRRRAIENARAREQARPGAVIIPGRQPADSYAAVTGFYGGWPIAGGGSGKGSIWPVHCYGMVGVGRGYSPDTGSGAELYTVIGHAPRHLDRNIALVGRVVEGIEHLSSLPRGTGALGFYERAEQRVPIASIRLASELPAAEQPRFQYLSTETDSFARYADARANRRDPFFIEPAGGADICNIPVPVRRVPK